MGKGNKPWLRGAVMLAILGVLMAALVASPATAHFLHPSKAQVKKVAKKQATNVFNNLFPGAIAPIEAANQDKCTNGTVLAYAHVQGGSLPLTFTSTGVTPQFNCAGGPILALRNSEGDYEVQIPGITTPSIPASDSMAINVSVGNDVNEVASFETSSGNDFIEVNVWDLDDNLASDDEFTIAVYNNP